jgi:hypothetical protein
MLASGAARLIGKRTKRSDKDEFNRIFAASEWSIFQNGRQQF